MCASKPFEQMEGLSTALSNYSSLSKQLTLSNSENYKRLIDSLSKSSEISATVAEIVGRQTQLLRSLSIPFENYRKATEALSLQWDTLATISKVYETPEIRRLHADLMANNFSGLQTFIDSLNASYIEAPNIALLKSARVFESVSASLPRGLATVVKDMHVSTAERLACSENISLNLKEKTFFVEESPEDQASVVETNIICSGLSLLDGLEEADLISFLNHLARFPGLASNHPVGQQIHNSISAWNDTMDFDRDLYYHARALPEGRCPYTAAQLGKAPSGVTWHGRYNYVGESHFYFSDKERGAVQEVKKHTKEKQAQVATLVPQRKIKMIDLSQVGAKNKFLEYCRFAPDPNDYSNIKREYLIPCYVANCCKFHGIDGIKYYGSKDYSNYVAWEDSYFSCVNSKVISL